MEFLLQFLAQAWRLIAFIVFMIGLAIFVSWRNAQQAKKARAEKKARMNPNQMQERQQSQKKRKSSAKRRKQAQPSLQQPEPDEDEMLFAPSAEGSIFDDDDLFPDAGDEDFDDLVAELEDDPLAELYAARAEAQREEIPEDDDDEVVDLASLLSGMAEEPEDYHRILDTPVAVKLITKQKSIAKELLTIMRDERDARLMVQTGDVAYRTLQDDKAAKKQFAAIMQELSGLIHKPDSNPPADVDVSGYEPNQMVSKPIDVQVSNGGKTQAREMISILRDEADGHLIIQIGNTGYRTLAGQDKAKNGFAKIMKELSQSVTIPDDNPPEVKVAPSRKKKPSNEPLPPLPKFGDAALGLDLKDEVLPGDIRMPKMDELPDAYEVGRFGRVKVKKLTEQEKVDPLNIAEAIEEYLQYKISITPQFQNRGIHIRSGFGGGVRIDVDGESYDFVDEISDKDAQAFIKQAIDEWQERH